MVVSEIEINLKEAAETMLENFFTPKSVAVIGASAEPGKVGYDIVHNLIDAKFQGEVYPINPKAETIQGLKVYKTVLDVPGEVDLAVIVIPAKFVAATMEQLGQKGTKAVVIITAGFKEVGAEGKAMQQEVMDVAAKYGIRVIGPNCLGIISTGVGLNASFAPNTPKNGHIALVSQSGALACAILDWATQAGIGFNKFFTIGNQADVATNDLLKAWKDDPEVRVMVTYMEAIADGIEFMKIAEDVSRVKPIVMVKSGTTAAGAKAAASHTGSLAGSDAAYDAAFKQSGVIRANTVEEFFDYSIAFANQPIPKGKRICIVTNAGGPGIICSDAIEKMGLTLATISEKTVEILKTRVSPSGNFNNPIDVLGDAKAAIYKFATETVLQDEGVDGVIVIVTPQSSTEIVETAQAVADLQTDKPILTCFMGGTLMQPAVSLLMDNEVPNYEFPERAVSAFKAMVDYATWRNLPIEAPKTFTVDKAFVAAAFAKTRAEGRKDMNEVECADILRAYGFVLPGNKLCATADEAVAFSNEIGYPVVMKIASPDILHKSDVGGVKVGLKNADEVRSVFESMTTSIQAKKPEANIWGVNIQQMITEGKQTILGMSRDPQFGPMIMFGLGGIYVEVLKDVVFRIAPLNAHTANEMVHAIRSFKLLAGARGEKPSDINAVVESIQRLSQLVTDFPEIIEMDINPLVALPEGGGAISIDSRISLQL